VCIYIYIYIYIYLLPALVGARRVQDITMRRMQMAAALIVSTLASTILVFRDANGLMLVLDYIEGNC
jgi:hypothetical protein